MKSFVLSSALALVICASAAATVTTPKSALKSAAPSSNEIAAKAELTKLENHLKTSTGMSYDAAVTVTLPSAAGTAPKNFKNSVIVEKAGRMYETFSPVGTGHEDIYMDGKTVTLYVSGLSKYITSPGGSGIAANMPALFKDLIALQEQSDADALFTTEFSNAFPSSYLNNEILFPPMAPNQSAAATLTHNTLNGESVDVLTQTLSTGQVTMMETYSVDKSTTLPVAFSLSARTPNGKVQFAISEVFTNFQLLTTAAADSSFAFTPPAGATLVAAAPTPAEQPSKLLTTGTAAPDFTIKTVTGKYVKLSDYAGKVVVLDFWATWCPPCQASLPHTDAIAKKYMKQGVVFLPVCSWDDHDAFNVWLKAHKSFVMAFYFDPAGRDEGGSIASKLYGVDGIPTQYVIGKDRKVIASFVGYDQAGDPNETGLTTSLDKAIAKS